MVWSVRLPVAIESVLDNADPVEHSETAMRGAGVVIVGETSAERDRRLNLADVERSESSHASAAARVLT